MDTYESGHGLTLSEWLIALNQNSQSSQIIDYCFPSERHHREYIATIHTRDVVEVKSLLRRFLFDNCRFPQDNLVLKDMVILQKTDKERFLYLSGIEYVRRVMTTSVPWQGNTWILDLLPSYPRLALEALDAYFTAHIQFLPDGRFDGIVDAKSIIRSRFINTSPDKNTANALLSLVPYEFELLINDLYEKMGYSTQLTKKTRDGGIDIIGLQTKAGIKEKVLIQCKRYALPVGEPDVRDLLGTVFNRKANRGVLISCCRFTRDAKRFAKKNPIELIDGKSLTRLLNEYLGTDWALDIDRILSRCRRSAAKAKKR